MASNEEYLDGLLRSMNGTGEKTEDKDNSPMTAEEIEAMFAVVDRITAEETGETPQTVDMPESTIPENTIPESTIPENTMPENTMPEILQEPTEIPEDMFSEISPEDVAVLDDILAENTDDTLEEETQSSGFTETEPSGEYTVENTRSMSEEEIENLLKESEQYGGEGTTPEKVADAEEISLEDLDNDDLLALLGSLDEKTDLGNIDDFIGAQNEKTDLTDIRKTDAEDEAASPDGETEKEEREHKKKAKQEEKKASKEEKKAAKEAKKAEKEAKKAQKKQKGIKPQDAAMQEAFPESDKSAAEQDNIAGTAEKKKSGKVSKLFAFLTEEDEEPASDENRSIIEELEAEDLAESGKKKKIKKGKMPKKGESEQKDSGEEDTKKKSKAKPKKKAPKPKKQKAPKAEAVEETRPSRRISSKSIAVIVAFAATLFLIVFFAGTYFSNQIQIDRARKAFRKMDYATCYAEMYGMELSEEEKEMFKHAELVLKMQRRIEVYEMYLEENKKLEAIDSLMQAVAGYEDTYAQALEYGAGPEVAALYDKILAILKDTYGLSQDEAHAIAACDTNVEYTRYLTALAEGGLENSGVSVPEGEMQDILQAEEELGKPEFAD